MKRELEEFFRDLDDLYAWMDSIYKVDCPSGCNVCCTRDIIWMLLPELVRLNKFSLPKKVEFGCPFRTDNGCSIYEYRPLVCRSYGSDLIKGWEIATLTVELNKGMQEIAGPGICYDKKPKSECNIEDLNSIYDCYAAMSKKYGLVAIGACNDMALHVSQMNFIRELQEYCSEYQIYVPDGIPVFGKKLQLLYSNF